jgi:hypothetical protein
MRRMIGVACVVAATMPWIGSVQAIERPVAPGSASAFVTRVADLDRPSYARHSRHRGHWQWRYRAAYTRWLHNEYVVAGYPVHQYRSPTYYWIEPCCERRRHW